MKFGVREPERLGAVRLEDGRQLGWAQWGPEDGTPVLFFSGSAMGRSLGFGGDVLGRLGVRLISVDRPGLGSSDADPERSLTDWAADVSQLVDGLGLTGARGVGFSHGAPFTLVCAAAGVLSAAAVVSGLDELSRPELAPLLDPDVAELVRLAAADPAAFEVSFTSHADADMLWGVIERFSPQRDMEIYAHPAFEPAYRRSLTEGFSQGAAGYARDLTLAYRPWPFDVADITVPVDLWYGGHDPGSVHSPDHGATLAARIPKARRHVIPDSGGAILWTHAEDILRTLLAR
ncbi:alpha/beta fold hydrolase [Bailinhaonella thermotolerans]|uniref:Alpha/beta hydrolase n=1 Tax=Bailinhaonella thermotolerans TaxID=1070861 RepID=A0A3A4BL41_9ACTN|nr:alpha/beta hydrolase [Bailinhaonella thermotolerans]RJL31762.1 alpha/beta hydrolase [Bailinhaonella thermotolerans]